MHELHEAARKGELDKLTVLLREHPELVSGKDDERRTPLHLAAENGHAACVRALIDAGADVDAGAWSDRTPLMFAAVAGRTGCVHMLIAAGADINSNRGYTVLHLAAMAGETDCLRALIAAGSDVNARREDGFTVLMAAAEKGKDGCVNALVSAGANVNVVVEGGHGWGGTALILAARYCSASSVEALIKAGADLEAKDKYGSTARMFAAEKGRREILAVFDRRQQEKAAMAPPPPRFDGTRYDYLGEDDISAAQRAFDGDIDTAALARLLVKIYTRSYLVNYGLNDNLCGADGCRKSPFFESRGCFGCFRCNRSFRKEHFNSEFKNKLAIAVGEALSKKGGIKLMQRVAKLCGSGQCAWFVSVAWDGVGGWTD